MDNQRCIRTINSKGGVVTNNVPEDEIVKVKLKAEINDGLEAMSNQTNLATKAMNKLNHRMKKIDKDDQVAAKILREHNAGEEISIKDIKKVYGKNWEKSLACTPLDGQVAKRDKKKAKQAKKSRKLNRRKR